MTKSITTAFTPHIGLIRGNMAHLAAQMIHFDLSLTEAQVQFISLSVTDRYGVSDA